MNKRTYIVIIIVLLIVVAVMAAVLLVTPAGKYSLIPAATSTAQNATGTTSPSQTDTSAALHDQVTVTSPKPNSTVSSTITVTGSAPGQWFFEAQFPVQVRDANGNLVGQSPAQAQGDWQTSGLVTFTDTITVDSSFHGSATLVLLKDNPSGLPQNDDSVAIPITVR